MRVLLALAFAATCLGVGSRAETLNIHIDSDFSISPEGGRAIEAGVRAALQDWDAEATGLSFAIVVHDNRINAKRSARHFDRYENDPTGIALVGGIYSPPYLTLRDSINRRGLLTLLPWSAAGPITRAAPGDENWIFRLSVDDSKAGRFIFENAIGASQCAAPAILLTDTGWGRTNRDTILEAFGESDIQPVADILFPSTIGPVEAAELATDVDETGADCVLLVAGMPAGGHLINAFGTLATPPKMISHWGVLSGDFRQAVSQSNSDRVRLEILQTCGLQAEKARPDQFRTAFAAISDADAIAVAGMEGQHISQLNQISGHTGFVHGYDITRVLLAAVRQSMRSGAFADADIAGKRLLVREALNALETPVEGLLKTYVAPFRSHSTDDPDAHEALGIDDLCWARFINGRLEPVTDGPAE